MTRKFIGAITLLMFIAVPLTAQGVPYVSAGGAGNAVSGDVDSLVSFGGTGALGMRSDRGFFELVGGWFPEQNEEPRWSQIGFEGGPRITSGRGALNAHAGMGGIYVAERPQSTGPVCEVCLFDVVAGPFLARGWSGYTTAGVRASAAITRGVDVTLGVRMNLLWLGSNRENVMSGWTLALTRTLN